MQRTVMIGLDGAPFSLLLPLADEGVMPFLRQFLREGVRAPLMSTPHPLTPPAWTSMITGRGPGQHGIFDFIWAEQRGTEHYFTIHNFRDIRSETIWSNVSRQGGSVWSLNFPLMAPPPKINGAIVPGFVSWKYLKQNVHPRSLYDELKTIPGFNAKQLAWDFEMEKKAEQGIPEAEYERWAEFHVARERQWFEITRYMFHHHPSDLMSILFDGLDKTLHMGYRFVDLNTFPENPSDWDRSIREHCLTYFRVLDGFLREIVEMAGPETRVFITSDHGFGPSRFVFRVNSWLESQGYLVWKSLEGLDEDERRAADKVAEGHFVLLDWDKTTAYARTVTSNGIYIRVARQPGESGIRPEQYESFRAELVRKLLDTRDPETGQKIVVDVLLKEQAFPGDHNAGGPDLTLVMCDHSFISVKNKLPVVFTRPEIEGTHYPEGVFMARGPGIRRGEVLPALNILDVAPCLMYSLGLGIPADYEGRLPTEVFEPSHLCERPPSSGDPGRSPDVDETSLEASGLLAEDEQEEVYKRLKALGYLE